MATVPNREKKYPITTYLTFFCLPQPSQIQTYRSDLFRPKAIQLSPLAAEMLVMELGTGLLHLGPPLAEEHVLPPIAKASN